MNDPDIKYFLGKLAGSMEAVERDIATIKKAQIPDGQNRMTAIETKVQNLNVWKGTVMAVWAIIAAGFAVAIDFVKDLLGGLHG